MTFDFPQKNDSDNEKNENLETMHGMPKLCVQITKNSYNLSFFIHTQLIASKRELEIITRPLMGNFAFFFTNNLKKNKIKTEFLPIQQEAGETYFPEEIEEIIWPSLSKESKSVKKISTSSYYDTDKGPGRNDAASSDTVLPKQNPDGIDKSSSPPLSPPHMINSLKPESEVPLSKINKRNMHQTKDQKLESETHNSYIADSPLSSAPFPNPGNLRKIRPLNETKYQAISSDDNNRINPSLKSDKSSLVRIDASKKSPVKDDYNEKPSALYSVESKSSDAHDDINDNKGNIAKIKNISNLEFTDKPDTINLVNKQPQHRHLDDINKSILSNFPSSENFDFVSENGGINDNGKGKNVIDRVIKSDINIEKSKKINLQQPYSSTIIRSFDLSDPATVPKATHKREKEDGVIINKSESIKPRPSIDGSAGQIDFSQSPSPSSSTLPPPLYPPFPFTDNIKEEKIAHNSHSITVKRLDIKIIGDTFLSDINGNAIEENIQENYQEKTTDDIDDYSSQHANSLNKSYFWRYKINL